MGVKKIQIQINKQTLINDFIINLRASKYLVVKFKKYQYKNYNMKKYSVRLRINIFIQSA